MNGGVMTVLAAGVPLGGAVLADPSDGDMTSTSVTPGNGAFIVMFLLAVAVVLLAVDMTRRVRRIQAKGRAEEHLAQEETPEEDGGETADGPSSAGRTPARGTMPPRATPRLTTQVTPRRPRAGPKVPRRQIRAASGTPAARAEHRPRPGRSHALVGGTSGRRPPGRRSAPAGGSDHRDRDRHEVAGEARDGRRVEDLVEPEPAR